MTNPSNARSRVPGSASPAPCCCSPASDSASAFASPSGTVAAAAPRPARRRSSACARAPTATAVKSVQRALVRVGVGVKYGVDSYFGSATEASVKAFQRLKGLPDHRSRRPGDGRGVGLAARRSGRCTGGHVPTGPGPRLDRSTVRQVQQSLIAAGFPVASGADGVFGAGTERALKLFQQAKCLGVTGGGLSGDDARARVAASAPAAAPPRRPRHVVGVAGALRVNVGRRSSGCRRR